MIKSESLKMTPKPKKPVGENILSPIFNCLFRFAALFFVRVYQAILSPFLGGACRFEPTCSNYAVEVLQKQSPLTALFLILKRLSKCHPWGGQGYDPAPHLAIKTFDMKENIRERSFIS